MQTKLPLKKGEKVWLELEAKVDCDLMENEELMKLTFDRKFGEIGDLKITELVLKPTRFTQTLGNKIKHLLIEEGIVL